MRHPLLAIFGLCLVFHPASAIAWETLRRDLSNIRGLNYVPMEERSTAPYGTANAVVSWRYFDEKSVAKQIAFLKSQGFNSVRVFLSYETWLNGASLKSQNPFLKHFKTLMDLCDRYEIYIMPVVWNSFSPTGVNDSFEQLQFWGRSPGHENMTKEWIQSSLGNRYVTEVVRIAQRHRALFAYDVANEPDAITQEYFLTHFARLIRSLDQDRKHLITVGFARLTVHEPAMLRIHRHLDLVSFHPYYFFPEGTRRAINTARGIAATISPITPILATEGGSPGFLSRYKEQWGILLSHGVGAMPWVGFIDRRGSSLAYNRDSGFFCVVDHAARDMDEVIFVRQVADAQGVRISTPLPLRMDGQSPCEQQSTPVGYGFRETIRDLAPAQWMKRPQLSNDNSNSFEGYFGQILRLGQVGLGLLELRTNVDQPVLSQQEGEFVNQWILELIKRNLYGGTEPWINKSGQVAWDRYEELFTLVGSQLYPIIDRYRLEE